MNIAKNAEPAAWITSRLHPFGQDVGWVIPEGFAAYARVFHPPYRLTSSGTTIPVRWRDIAAANNRTIAAEMQRLDLSAEPSRFSRSGEELWTQQPASGILPREIAERLAAILASHTRTPESCWFGVWLGRGDLRIGLERAPVFSVPERDLFLLHGTVADVLTTISDVDWIYRSPNLWWPDDRAWCVATEIDFNWSYVGGSLNCIQQILSDSELEAVPTGPLEGNWMQDERQSPTQLRQENQGSDD
jgi:hypothetical protein